MVKSLKIGNLELPSPVLMAPMAGFTTDAFRRVTAKFGGVGLYVTEMMHARGLLEMSARQKSLHARLAGIPEREGGTPFFGGQGTEDRGQGAEGYPREALPPIPHSANRRLTPLGSPTPLAVQIWDNEADRLAEVAGKLLAAYEIAVIDLNFGCPEHDVTVKAQSGAWLLQFPEKIEKIVRQVVLAAGETPVTAKIRLGFHLGDYTAPEVVQAVESAGAAAVTVHGRTAEQMYAGSVAWEKIAELKPRLKRIPLIGNGNITSPEEAGRVMREAGVDGVMVGRAALGAPWIFRQIADFLRGEPESVWQQKPTLAEQKSLLLEHFSLILADHSPREAVIQMRKFAPRYGAGLPHARHFRTQLATITAAEDFRSVVEEFFTAAEHGGE